MDASTRYESHTPAYVLFTSGSTRKPKGCVVSRRALASTWYHCEQLQIRPESNVLQFASYCFGVSLIEIYCTLSAGGTNCIPSEDEKLNNLRGAINGRQVSWALLTPSKVNAIDPEALATLQKLIMAGEALGIQQLQRLATRVQLLQGYGLTEWAEICCVSCPLDLQADCTSIGRPMTAHLWLADPSDHIIPARSGEIAELLIAGSSMAHGYLDDANRTAAAFIKTPHWIEALGSDCKLVYRTGDLVQLASDGSLLYIGRKDRLVKIRGSECS
jgi:non-ribosomal peptide synthetase component F